MEEKIRARIEQLRIELEKFVIDANEQIAAYRGAIGELENLLKKDETPKDE